MIPVIDLESYRYDLPKERIAHYPVHHRDQSKLLLCDATGEISETVFYNPGNNSRENGTRDFLKNRWKDKYGY